MRTFELKNSYLGEYNPWSGIPEYTDFMVKSTYHTMLQATYDQLVLIHDMLLNTPLISGWGYIIRCKK